MSHLLPQVADVFKLSESACVVILVVFEVVGLALVARLWVKGKKTSVVSKVLRSVILLIPFFGLIFFIPLLIFPEPHTDEIPPDRSAGGGF